MPASTILLIDADRGLGETIAAVLSGVGYTVTTVADPNEAFGQVADHQLVIIDVVAGDKSAVDVCREIRATPSLVAIPVLCVSQTDDVEERIQFLEAGADDVMAKPFDARELEARVEALLLRFQRSKDLDAVVSTDGITVTRPPDGRRPQPAGRRRDVDDRDERRDGGGPRKPDRVVIVDLDLQFGQVATHLNIEPPPDPRRRRPRRRRDARARAAPDVRDAARQRPPRPRRSDVPELAELVTAEHIDRILTTLLDTYDQVVIDTGSWLDERTHARVRARREVLFVVMPGDRARSRRCTALVEYLSEAGTVAAKSTFVLNNTFGREILKLRDVEKALGTKVAMELPYDPFLYLKAVNEGVPIVLGAPRSLAAERLAKLSRDRRSGRTASCCRTGEPKKSGRFGFRRR